MAPRVLPVLLLVLLPLALPGVLAQGATIDIRSFSFSPARLEVDPATRVTVTNHDAAPHSVKHAQFDSGILDQGQSGTFTAPSEPGEYPYACGVHASMRGTLVVRGATATTPAASTPATSTPPSTTPATSTPATSTPAASTPATSTPATSTPLVSTLTTPAATTTTNTPPSPGGAEGETDADAPGPGLALLLAATVAGLVLRRRRQA